MTKNWAVVVGINAYNPLNFSTLNYARQDAEMVKAFFESLNFDQVYLFTEESPPILLPDRPPIPTDPTYGNLVSFLEDRFQPGILGSGDNCWFFFAGHGERHGDKDYLMPRDANSRGTKVISGLQVDEVREWLTRSGAGTVILLLDACRSQGSRDGSGIDPTDQKGVITISSCNPTQKAWEIPDLEQGVFTYALLEALQLSGEQSCATVERLGNYLKARVPDLCRRYGKPEQNPRTSVDPIEKQHFILMPQFARQADIDLMKSEGFRLAFEGKLQLAEQLFLRANAAAQGRDVGIVYALARVHNQLQGMAGGVSPKSSADSASGRSPTADTVSVSDVAEGAIASPSASSPSGDDPVSVSEVAEELLAPPSSPAQKEDLTPALESKELVARATPSQPKLKVTFLQESFHFETAKITIQKTGVYLDSSEQVVRTINREFRTAQYFAEDLGNGVALEMVQIPGGTFMMGSPETENGSKDERPQHSVTVPSFFMGKFSVTQAQYKAVMGNNPATKYDSDRFVAPKKPVVGVSWHDAIAFCERLSQRTGKKYRLPSEAEWEYACRAGTTTPFYFGETITSDLANYDGNYTYGSGPKGIYRKKTTEVGSFLPNAFGLFDMHGNVREWCLDYWHENYQGAPTDGRAWAEGGDSDRRIRRGGSWSRDPRDCRSASRGHFAPDYEDIFIGFRVVVAPQGSC